MYMLVVVRALVAVRDVQKRSRHQILVIHFDLLIYLVMEHSCSQVFHIQICTERFQ